MLVDALSDYSCVPALVSMIVLGNKKPKFPGRPFNWDFSEISRDKFTSGEPDRLKNILFNVAAF